MSSDESEVEWEEVEALTPEGIYRIIMTAVLYLT